MRISFIILTWNSESYINDCISSIIEKCEEERIVYEILVVDNGSTDKTKDILMKYKNQITIILLKKNHGTTYPRNLALRKAKGDIICFLDSDAILKRGKLKLLCQKLFSSDDIGIIAPRLILPDGSIQRSVKKFPLIFEKLLKLQKIFLGIEPKRNEYYKNLPLDKEVTIDSAISACWFFRKDLIKVADYLDEKIFYSPEDLDYCLTVWKRGKKVLYYPFFEVLHYTQQTSHKNSLILLHHFIGLLYYFVKHRYIFKRPKYGEWEN